MSGLKVDLGLVKKYNVPGPRYTSYPPATHFHDGLDLETWREKVVGNNREPAPLSLYYHIPFCQSLCWYCGCTTVITTKRQMGREYLRYLGKEMDLIVPLLHEKREVVQLHLGGGTPTFLSAEEMEEMGRMLHSRFRFDPRIEAGIEIDPRELSKEQLEVLRGIGFNRASIGVQDHNRKVQEAVHRVQPREQTEQAVSWIRETGFTSLNIDLIYGLPHQTPESFEKTLDEILELRPDRLAVFSYAHVPWVKPAQRILKDDILPSAEVKLELLKMTIEKLTSGDYVYIGMDHFARVDDELAVAQREKRLQRNFQGYSTWAGVDIYAFGMSSISQAGGMYWQNEKELPGYYQALDQGKLPFIRGYVLNEEDLLRRRTIMRLMCDMELDYAAMSERLGIYFPDHFAAELEGMDDLEADGLIERDRAGLKVTQVGRLFIRNIAMRFDAYYAAAKERQYSKTI